MGARMQQRRTSSHWMACRRYFLSNPRPISGIARKDSVTSLSIKLEARSAVHCCFRAYQIDVDTDLFGVWLVEMSYGRIGGLGRSKIRSFTTIEGAQAQVHACLRKRATAPRRIGVAYRVRGRTRCEQWCQPDLVDHLDAWFPVPGAVSS
jgi:predicted DNA-binding WGR domain protein